MRESYYITGMSGTGKTTTARELGKSGYAVYDIDKVKGLCHWRHSRTKARAKYYNGVDKEWLDAHEWICDEEQLKVLLSKGHEKGTVVSGIASNQEGFYPLFNSVFLLCCSEETLIRRLSTRNDGINFGKDPSEQVQILGWYQIFQERTKQLGAIPINSDAPLQEVVGEIRSKI